MRSRYVFKAWLKAWPMTQFTLFPLYASRWYFGHLVHFIAYEHAHFCVEDDYILKIMPIHARVHDHDCGLRVQVSCHIFRLTFTWVVVYSLLSFWFGGFFFHLNLSRWFMCFTFCSCFSVFYPLFLKPYHLVVTCSCTGWQLCLLAPFFHHFLTFFSP